MLIHSYVSSQDATLIVIFRFVFCRLALSVTMATRARSSRPERLACSSAPNGKSKSVKLAARGSGPACARGDVRSALIHEERRPEKIRGAVERDPATDAAARMGGSWSRHSLMKAPAPFLYTSSVPSAIPVSRSELE